MRSAIVKNGIVRNIIAGELDGSIPIDDLDPQPRVGWSYDGENFTAPDAPEQEPQAPTVTYREFLRLFTLNEIATILETKKTDSTVEAFLLLAQSGDTVKLTDPDVDSGLGYLKSLDIIDDEREAEIKAGQAPTQPIA